jgi:WD40 repeat-containing protein SMU1
MFVRVCVLAPGWDSVVASTSTMTLPIRTLMDLFEQMIFELIEGREFDTARALLRAAPAMHEMKRTEPQRYLLIEHMLAPQKQNAAFDAAAAYPKGGTKEKRRAAIAAALAPEVSVVAPSRLLTLLSQSLKYQQLQGLLPKGGRYDLFAGSAAAADRGPAGATAAETFPTRNSKVIKFGKRSYAECARFSPDGNWLVSGSVEGYIEIWDADSGKLNTDLQYQAEDQLMSHDAAVLSIAFNIGCELLASGSSKGEIKVWRIATGSCVRKFSGAHAEGVTSLEFYKDGTQILSASFDQTVK